MSFFPGTDIPAERLGADVSAALLRFVEDASRSRTKFPGPSPVSIERRHFPVLRKELFLVSAKTDGVRAALVCLRVGTVDYVAFMDRNRHFYAIHGPPFEMCTAWFQGTIVDGEIMGTGFFAFDALVVAGACVAMLPFSERRHSIAHGLAMHHQSGKSPPIRILTKPFHVPSEFDVGLASAPGADGLIVHPERAPYVIGRHIGLFKVKTHHTIDFVLCENGQLAVNDRGGPKLVAQLASKPDGNVPAGSIVECEPVAGGKWRVVMVRTDKDHPNDATTYRGTLTNIKENLSYDEVLSALLQRQ
jgi:hypothetical protein